MVKVLTNVNTNVLAEYDSIQDWGALGGSVITATQGRPGSWETLPARIIRRENGDYFKVQTNSAGRKEVILKQDVEMMVWGRQILVDSDETVWVGDLSPLRRYVVLYCQLNFSGAVFTASFGTRTSATTWDERGSDGDDLSQRRSGWSQVDIARWTTDDPTPELIGAPVPFGAVERTSAVEKEEFLDHTTGVPAGQVKEATGADVTELSQSIQNAIKGVGIGALAVLKPSDQIVTAVPPAKGFKGVKTLPAENSGSTDYNELVGVGFSINITGFFNAWIEFEDAINPSSEVIPTVLPPFSSAIGSTFVPPTTADNRSAFRINSIGMALLPGGEGCYRFLLKWPDLNKKPFDVIHVDINNKIVAEHAPYGHDAVVWNGSTLSENERQNWRSIDLNDRFIAESHLGPTDSAGAVTTWKLQQPTLRSGTMVVEVDSNQIADILNGNFTIDVSSFNWTVPGSFTFVLEHPMGLVAKRIRIKAAGNLTEAISATIITSPGSVVAG